MTRNVAVALGATVLLTVGQANALTLTNLDDADQRLQIVEWLEETMAQSVVLAAGQTLVGLCNTGCTITVENGESGSFEGFEVVYIEDGRLTTDDE